MLDQNGLFTFRPKRSKILIRIVCKSEWKKIEMAYILSQRDCGVRQADYEKTQREYERVLRCIV